MNKTYVITGSTSGIGKALLIELAKDNTVFAGFRQEKYKEELQNISGNIHPFYIDYNNPETIQNAANYINEKCEKIDTLVNVVGCVVAGPIEKISINEIKRQFNVNVFGHIEFTQGLINKLENGKIINVSSMASYGLFPFISPYCSSKKCLDMFFNSLLLENKKNIKVVSIKPGVIATPLWSKSIEENTKNLSDCDEYKRELDFIVRNAKRNEEKGFRAEKVVETILKADKAKNPKLTYTVGADAFFVRFATKLPQGIQNALIKLGMKRKFK